MKKIKISKKARKYRSTNRIPKFIIYSLVYKTINSKKKNKNKSSSKKFFFQCNIYKKIFKAFLKLKRHFIEVEYNIKIKCKFCGLKVKRIAEHHKTCKKMNNNKKNILLFSHSDYASDIKDNNLFQLNNINDIVSILIDDLKNKHKYYEVTDKYIYFHDYIIGEGNYGLVTFGVKIDDNSPVAVKLQLESNGKDELNTEKDILNSFPFYYPFPKFYYHEVADIGNILIQSLTGPSLDKLYKFCGLSFDETTICNIGIDLLECLEILHKDGLVHNDMKLDNMAILLQDIEKEKSDISCILIDFGFAIKYNNDKYIKGKKEKAKQKCGNTKFASFYSLNGGKIGPKDDLESLCYILLYLFNKTLPWSKLNKNNKIYYRKMVLKEKANFNINTFCSQNCIGLSDIFNDIKNLKENETPKYAEYKKILIKIIEENKKGNKTTYRFKWQKTFSDIMKEFYINKNFQILNEAIKKVFKGYPEQIGFSFINQFYIN